MAASMSVLQSEGFNGTDFDNYTLTNSADTSLSFSSTGSDYIIRTSSPTAVAFSQAVTGFNNNFIALEDIDSVGFTGEEGYLNLSPIVGSYNNLGIGFTFAAPSSAATRYEPTDLIELQYRVDGGSWTVASDTSYNGNSTSAGLHNGASNVTTGATAVFADLTGVSTSSSFQVRVHFISGTQEEMAFDDIVVRGDVTPEPSSSFMLLLGGLTICLKRRK